MLNNINERGLSEQNTVKVKNFPGAKTLDNLLESKPDELTLHAGTNEFNDLQ